MKKEGEERARNKRWAVSFSDTWAQGPSFILIFFFFLRSSSSSSINENQSDHGGFKNKIKNKKNPRHKVDLSGEVKEDDEGERGSAANQQLRFNQGTSSSSWEEVDTIAFDL